MKILMLSKYSELGASSRIRSYQYIPYLERAGFKIFISPLFDDKYIYNFYKRGKRDFFYIIKSYIKRLKVLFNSKKYDLIWIEKELFPYLPPLFELFLIKIGKDYIIDYDDAIFHNYDLNKNLIIRLFLKNKIKTIMKNSILVIVGNDYLAEYAKKARVKNLAVLPSSIDLEKYIYHDKFNLDTFKIGWIGTPITFKYLETKMEIFKKFCKEFDAKLTIIGAKSINYYVDFIEFKKWDEKNEVKEIQNFDVGIMPLNDDPWERGKCGYKLLQYMACGRPVIASPIGINNKIVKHNINGFLANSDQEWYDYLKTLYENVDLRKKMGNEGRKLVEIEYSLENNSLKLINLLKNLKN